MNPFLKNQHVALRKISETENLENYLSFINDPDNLTWLSWVGNFPMNLEDLQAYIRANTNLFLGVFNTENEHVGNIQLGRIDYIHRNAEFGMLVDRNHQGKGLASSACKLILKHAFEVINLHRIYLVAIAENIFAINLYERLGFVQEGIEKDVHYYRFQFYDGIRFRLLEDEYREAMKHW